MGNSVTHEPDTIAWLAFTVHTHSCAYILIWVIRSDFMMAMMMKLFEQDCRQTKYVANLICLSLL